MSSHELFMYYLIRFLCLLHYFFGHLIHSNLAISQLTRPSMSMYDIHVTKWMEPPPFR